MSRSEGILKQSSVIFLAVAVFNIVSLLYQLYMVRALSPIDYGILNSLFSILMIISIPSSTLQTVVTKYISHFYAVDDHDRINLLLRSFVKKTIVFGLIIFLVLMLGSKYVSSFLQISSPLLIMMLGLVTFFSVILPLAQGGLQGLQRFGSLGVSMILNGCLKLVLGILFVSSGFGVMGAMGALAISTFAALLLAFALLVSVLKRPLSLDSKRLMFESEASDNSIDFTEIYKYFYATATVFLCYMLITNIDIILVKHFFDPSDAGYYSISQMVGKMILFLPIAITMVMFPKVSRLYAQEKSSKSLLTKSLLYSGLMCGSAAIVCIFFPGMVIKLLSGEEHIVCIPLVRIFSVTMVFFAMVYTLLFYQLAIHCLNFIRSLIFLTVLQAIMIYLFHQSLMQILYIMCGNAILLFVVNIFIVYKQKELHFVSSISSDP